MKYDDVKDRCWKTGKHSFPSERKAKNCGRKKGDHLRYYRCDHCGRWHMTSSFELDES